MDGRRGVSPVTSWVLKPKENPEEKMVVEVGDEEEEEGRQPGAPSPPAVFVQGETLQGPGTLKGHVTLRAWGNLSTAPARGAHASLGAQLGRPASAPPSPFLPQQQQSTGNTEALSAGRREGASNTARGSEALRGLSGRGRGSGNGPLTPDPPDSAVRAPPLCAPVRTLRGLETERGRLALDAPPLDLRDGIKNSGEVMGGVLEGERLWRTSLATPQLQSAPSGFRDEELLGPSLSLLAASALFPLQAEPRGLGSRGWRFHGLGLTGHGRALGSAPSPSSGGLEHLRPPPSRLQVGEPSGNPPFTDAAPSKQSASGRLEHLRLPPARLQAGKPHVSEWRTTTGELPGVRLTFTDVAPSGLLSPAAATAAQGIPRPHPSLKAPVPEGPSGARAPQEGVHRPSAASRNSHLQRATWPSSLRLLEHGQPAHPEASLEAQIQDCTGHLPEGEASLRPPAAWLPNRHQAPRPPSPLLLSCHLPLGRGGSAVAPPSLRSPSFRGDSGRDDTKAGALGPVPAPAQRHAGSTWVAEMQGGHSPLELPTHSEYSLHGQAGTHCAVPPGVLRARLALDTLQCQTGTGDFPSWHCHLWRPSSVESDSPGMRPSAHELRFWQGLSGPETVRAAVGALVPRHSWRSHAGVAALFSNPQHGGKAVAQQGAEEGEFEDHGLTVTAAANVENMQLAQLAHRIAEEDDILLEHVRHFGTRQWTRLRRSGTLPGRDNKACCNRYLLLKRQSRTSSLAATDDSQVQPEDRAQGLRRLEGRWWSSEQTACWDHEALSEADTDHVPAVSTGLPSATSRKNMGASQLRACSSHSADHVLGQEQSAGESTEQEPSGDVGLSRSFSLTSAALANQLAALHAEDVSTGQHAPLQTHGMPSNSLQDDGGTQRTGEEEAEHIGMKAQDEGGEEGEKSEVGDVGEAGQARPGSRSLAASSAQGGPCTPWQGTSVFPSGETRPFTRKVPCPEGSPHEEDEYHCTDAWDVDGALAMELPMGTHAMIFSVPMEAEFVKDSTLEHSRATKEEGPVNYPLLEHKGVGGQQSQVGSGTLNAHQQDGGPFNVPYQSPLLSAQKRKRHPE